MLFHAGSGFFLDVQRESDELVGLFVDKPLFDEHRVKFLEFSCELGKHSPFEKYP